MGGRFKDGSSEYKCSKKGIFVHHSFGASVSVHLYSILELILILMTPSGVSPLGLDSHWYRMG